MDGTRQPNFAILNFTKKMILIGGTGYAGEMKKGIFGVLNYLLPHEHNTLSMHCSANVGEEGDTAIFFGLSGTGKTTLSADPNRGLIGDDEHGWTPDAGIFNFEGGCYAKVIDLSQEKEPEIWDAIRFGAIVENTRFVPGTHTVDYANKSVTENTRTAYPINFIPNAIEPGVADAPKNIFFLTADAFGVIPPISKLDKSHAMYLFMSGYTAKVAGTEMGVTEPQTTFSACFGAVFLPLHPTKYAEMLGQKMDENPDINVWLINTGWTGGSYGTGSPHEAALHPRHDYGRPERPARRGEIHQAPRFWHDGARRRARRAHRNSGPTQHLGRQRSLRPDGQQAGREVRRKLQEVRGVCQRGNSGWRAPRGRRGVSCRSSSLILA